MLSQQDAVTSGRLRGALLGLESIIGLSVTETIIEKLNMKGISYALDYNDIAYHKSEIAKALRRVLGPDVGGLLMRHLCEQCEELR